MHLNHIGSMNNLDAVQRDPLFPGYLLQLLLVTGEKDLHTVGLYRHGAAFQHRQRSVIPAKSIHYNLHLCHPAFRQFLLSLSAQSMSRVKVISPAACRPTDLSRQLPASRS